MRACCSCHARPPGPVGGGCSGGCFHFHPRSLCGFDAIPAWVMAVVVVVGRSAGNGYLPERVILGDSFFDVWMGKRKVRGRRGWGEITTPSNTLSNTQLTDSHPTLFNLIFLIPHPPASHLTTTQSPLPIHPPHPISAFPMPRRVPRHAPIPNHRIVPAHPTHRKRARSARGFNRAFFLRGTGSKVRK